MSLLGGSVTGCQATDNIWEHNFWEHNFLRGCGFAFLSALLSWVFLTGCAGVASSNTTPAGGKGLLSTSSSTVPFGNVNAGSASTQTITLGNTGNATLTVTQVIVSGPGFTISGATLPLTLAIGQSSPVTAKFAPTVAGTASGTISFVSNGSNSPTVVALTATGMAATSSPQLRVSPTSANFAVNIGSSQSQPVTVTNAGTTMLSITQANVSGSGFSVSGLALPLNLPSGQGSSFNINFSPTAAGSVTGSVSLVTNSVTAASQITLTGTGVQAPSGSVTGVTISPTNPTVQTSHTVQFTATVQGTATDKSVKWTASAGTIDPSGLFTAPSAAGTATVTATSNADASKQASTTVTVNAPPTPGGPLAAFPGAQGGGAISLGGRGGVVYEVTTLNEGGTGSLRACIEASGPRTCVFRVGGTINLASALNIINPYITIAGQTAPGGGIQLISPNASEPSHSILINSHDVVLRYLRIRHGYNPNDVLGGGDGSDIYVGNYGDGYNIMIDHCSLQWAHGQSLDVWDNNATPGRIHNIALSWSLAGETLQDHPVVTIAGSNILANAAAMNDVDYHHNLLATDSHRIPLFKVANGRLVNNLIYNWSYYSSLSGGGAVVDYINNVYRAGPLTPAPGTTGSFEIMAYSLPGCTSCGPSGDPSIYMSGNLGPNDPNGANNAANLFRQVSNEGPGTISIAPSSWVRSTPQGAGTGVAIVADPTAAVVTNVLNNVGASNKLSDTACDGSWVSNRDSVDTRMINEYNAGAGSYPTTQNDKGGFPTLAAGTPCTSTAHDGISDVWKTAHGLNPSDPSVAQKTAPNGYTYLENYLNGTDPNLTASTNPTVLPAKGGSLMSENHLDGTRSGRSVSMNFLDPKVLPWLASNNRGSVGRQREVSRASVSAP